MVIKVKVNGEWIKVPCAVEEAPKDGQQYVRKDGDWSAVEIPEVDLSGIESSIETIETSINELDTNKASKTEVTEQINAAVASVYKIKGSVDSYDALPNHNVSIGDVYNVLDTGANYVAIEIASSLKDEPTAVQSITWDKLSETVDLSNLATKTELSDLTAAVDTAVDEVSDKVDTLETSINGIESTLVTDGDGSQYLSNDGTYKTLDLTNADEVYISDGEAPTGNQEIWIDTSEDSLDGYLLDDAPSDGTTYGRKNGTWKEIPSQSTFSDTSATFESSTTYTDFPYQSKIALTGVTANDFVEVVFGINEALSGNYAPICLTEDGYVTIYSKVSDTITIPTIVIHK